MSTDASTLSIAAAVVTAVLKAATVRAAANSHHHHHHHHQASVTQLIVYPCKSMRGHSVASAIPTPRGFLYDRELVLASPDGGGGADGEPLLHHFLTQRTLPHMATLEVRYLLPPVPPPGWPPCPPAAVPSDVPVVSLELRETRPPPGANPAAWVPAVVVVPLALAGTAHTVRVWDSMVENGVDQGDAAASFFAAALGVPCPAPPPRLILLPRAVDRLMTDPRAPPNSPVSFADGFPYLLACSSSLAALNAVAPPQLTPLSMARFRPNIVVGGGAGRGPFEEARWARIEVGGVPFTAPKRCGRCKIPSLRPTDGVQEDPAWPAEGLRSLGQANGADVIFGQNLVCTAPAGVVRVGDSVKVVEVGEVPCE